MPIVRKVLFGLGMPTIKGWSFDILIWVGLSYKDWVTDTIQKPW